MALAALLITFILIVVVALTELDESTTVDATRDA